ncbi:hypothetical protein ACVW0B_002102 [Thermostichus sp. MS-CIW-23]|jgi:hypothetical protein|uniref:Mo-dependent nitrogenase C-terminal domain-containing protein n=1 Tax=Synechococcus sp. R5-13 TaxID=2291953 RepID=UPI0039C084EF
MTYPYPSLPFPRVGNPLGWLGLVLNSIFRSALKWPRRWLNSIEIRGSRQARWICRLIPASCPFERDIRLGSRTVHIPALCRINPLYEEIIALRLRAAAYLAEAAAQPQPPSSQEIPSCL